MFFKGTKLAFIVTAGERLSSGYTGKVGISEDSLSPQAPVRIRQQKGPHMAGLCGKTPGRQSGCRAADRPL
ncbi:hypothetical protein [Hydrogenophaga sp.]|uniref:hypothetical protein n=1 Tax=Hydrogenophaga sp. TaxID=1904254 RepID=UPI00356A046A